MKKKGSHSRALLGACVTGGYGKGGKKDKKGRHMTGFLFVRGCLWKFVEASFCKWNTEELRRERSRLIRVKMSRKRKTVDIKVPSSSVQHIHMYITE